MPLREGKKRLSQATLNPEELDTGLLNPSNQEVLLSTLPFSFPLPSPVLTGKGESWP